MSRNGKKNNTQECIVRATDVVKLLKLVEELVIADEKIVHALRAAKKLCPQLIGKNIEALADIHEVWIEDMDALIDLAMGLKESFFSDSDMVKKRAGIISDIPRWIQ